ncbi:hypothetical protein [Kingella oralis]
MNVTKPVTIAVSCALALTACKKSVSVDTKRHRSGDNSKALLITGKNNKGADQNNQNNGQQPRPAGPPGDPPTLRRNRLHNPRPHRNQPRFQRLSPPPLRSRLPHPNPKKLPNTTSPLSRCLFTVCAAKCAPKGMKALAMAQA